MSHVRHHPGEAHRDQGSVGRRRHIGPLGTAARLVVGVSLFGSVTYGHVVGDFRPGPWLLGLIGFPSVLVGWQRWRSRRNHARLEATGAVPQVLNVAAFLALYLTPDYASALAATSDAALVFYGTSMLIAARRGYGGCEVLAVSNWLLGRDDQLGCLLFAPVDHLEGRARRAAPSRDGPGPC